MVMVSLAFFFYFFSLLFFSLVSHPVYYCGLLVFNALLCSFICYCIYGFSWYALLFCLVYIGGVYILFVFVSVHNPNSSVVNYWDGNLVSCYIGVFVGITFGSLVYYVSSYSEFSSFLCTLSEGYFYLCMCLTLLFGFIVLSLVMSVKVNHYR